MKLSNKDRQEVKKMTNNGFSTEHIKKFLLDEAKINVEAMFNKYHYALDLHYKEHLKRMKEYYKRKYKEEKDEK